jgi:hypothetical protein
MTRPIVRISFYIASFTVSLLAIDSQHAAAQSTTEIVDGADGIRYRVTKQIIQRPVSKTEWDQQQQTVFRERYETQWHTNYRTYLTPVTEYRQELFLANRWNPLAMPYWTYRYVPVTRWESRYEPYSVPIAQRTLVPEQQTVQIPRTTTQMATEEQISKVAIGPSSSGGWTAAGSQNAVARRETVGGIKKLD